MAAAALLLAASASLTVGLHGHRAALAEAAVPTAVTSQELLARSVGAASMPGPAALQPLPDGSSTTAPTRSADPVRPVSLRIPAIGVGTTLGQLGLNPDATVQVPTDFAQAGWFSLGPAPGQLGSAVILGHVDSYQGPAVFYRLGSLHPGDEVEVALTNHTVAHFAVTTVTTYPKAQFPAEAVYAPHGGTALNLVTCGGEFDTRTRSYLSNVVVTTTLTALTTTPA